MTNPWGADEREYEEWLRAEGEDLIRFVAQQGASPARRDLPRIYFATLALFAIVLGSMTSVVHGAIATCGILGGILAAALFLAWLCEERP